MKRLFFFALLATVALRSAAETFTVHVGDFAFTPSTINNVHPGDVIMWVWDNGVHTTTSTMIPSNAAGWNSALSASASSFSYTVPNAVGTFHYQCNVHPAQMTGSFTVVSATGVANTSISTVSCTPNPVTNKLHVTLGSISSQVTLSICDITGKEILSDRYSTKEADIDVSPLPSGFYFLKAKEQDGGMSVQKIQVAR